MHRLADEVLRMVFTFHSKDDRVAVVRDLARRVDAALTPAAFEVPPSTTVEETILAVVRSGKPHTQAVRLRAQQMGLISLSERLTPSLPRKDANDNA